MKLPLVLGCVVGTLLLGGCATGPKTHVVTDEELFKQADKTSDGKVSRAEYQDFMVTQLFAIYDEDGDGLITEEEFVADGGGKPETFRKLNVSGTGKLTLEEAKASVLIRERMAGPFDEADVNKSGYVTWEEFKVAKVKADAYVR